MQAQETRMVSNKIEMEIKKIFPPEFHVSPQKSFYKAIGISQKRWALLIRNEKPATIEELGKVSQYFDIPINKLIDDERVNMLAQDSY